MYSINRRTFILSSLGILGAAATPSASAARRRPNILFALADDWSWPHASALGATGISTPVYDRLVREGCHFMNAFTAAPQCSPNRAATLTGRHIWQIAEAGTHGSIFPNTYPVFTDLLEAQGYHVGYTTKGWGPGDWKRGGWERNPAGPAYSSIKRSDLPTKAIQRTDYPANFRAFLDDRPAEAPFFFWFGATEPHRGYEQGSGVRAGKRLADVKVPGFLPDDPVVRGDLLDYFLEVEWFDSQVGEMLRILAERGELDNTIVVMTSDNGMPFPHAKANLYEYGTHVPLAIRWPGVVEPGRTADAPVSFIDFAPTFLEAAGVELPKTFTGTSLLPVLKSPDAPGREYVLTGRERHTHARYDNLGYPARAMRTRDYLYIRNFKPERWPAGDPPEYHDIDGGPTKAFMMENRADFPELFASAFRKRPAEELFAVTTDPECLHNLAEDPGHRAALAELRGKLDALLREQGDPRVCGGGDVFESYPRMSRMRPELGGFAERGKYNPAYAGTAKE